MTFTQAAAPVACQRERRRVARIRLFAFSPAELIARLSPVKRLRKRGGPSYDLETERGFMRDPDAGRPRGFVTA